VFASGFPGLHGAPDERPARTVLFRLVAAASLQSPRPNGYHALRRAGIVARRPGPGRALLVAFAPESPVPLPGTDRGGFRNVVVTKEVELR
jgi:hypothetical protein